jgi:hypothetical protein
MNQSQTQQLEEMHATLVRAIASLQELDVIETVRLLALLRGMVEGALAERNTVGGGVRSAPSPAPGAPRASLGLWDAMEQ